MNTDQLHHSDLALFAIGTQLKLERGSIGGSAWHATADIGNGRIARGAGERPWVAVRECFLDAMRDTPNEKDKP
jgi:hypothetical protein